MFHTHRAGGQGLHDIFESVRKSMDERFGTPVNIGLTVNSSSSDYFPCLSADALTLFFASDRPGGEGDADIWMSTRRSRDVPFGKPVNLGPTINSSKYDIGPALSADGLTLFFSSNRSGGSGLPDIWMSTRRSTDMPFGKPINLPRKVNSSKDDRSPALSADGRTLFFQSNREGGQGGHDLWMSRRVPKAGIKTSTTVPRTPLPDGPPGLVQELKGHTTGLLSIAFSPDGRSILSSSQGRDGTTRLWDVQTGKETE
jgi:Tol biopolymer transport system component